MLSAPEKFAKLTYRVSKPTLVYSIILLVCSFVMYILPVATFIAGLVFMVILILVMICTIFTILADPEFRDLMNNSTEYINSSAEALLIVSKASIFVLVGAVFFSIVSIVTALFDKTQYNKWPRLIVNFVVLGLCIIMGIIYFALPIDEFVMSV